MRQNYTEAGEALLEIMQQRRSIRKYTGEPIPEEKLEKVLQAGLLAESGRNIRPWEFIAVQDKESLCALAKSRTHGASMLEGAACAIIVVGDETKTDVWTEDCSIAMAHMHLMASALGLGSCWIQGRLREAEDGISTESVVQKLLGIPANYRLEAMLSLGVPADQPAAHALPDPKDDKVHYEKFA